MAEIYFPRNSLVSNMIQTFHLYHLQHDHIPQINVILFQIPCYSWILLILHIILQHRPSIFFNTHYSIPTLYVGFNTTSVTSPFVTTSLAEALEISPTSSFLDLILSDGFITTSKHPSINFYQYFGYLPIASVIYFSTWVFIDFLFLTLLLLKTCFNSSLHMGT